MAYAVLIVDDSKTVRSMIKKTLQLTGLDLGTVHEAGNGIEALTVLRSEWIDVVLADIHMPEMGGIELVEQMSKDHVLGSIPVIMVSSDRNQTHIDHLWKLGVRSYLNKPFRPEALGEAIQKVLGGSGGQ